MFVYNDLEPSEKLKIYDKGVSFTDDPAKIYQMRVGYLTGDMWAPKLDESEALRAGATDFVEAIEHKKKTLCDGRLGARVIQIIEAATSSMKARGETIHLPRSEKVL
jgi:hypothetical protein